MKGILKKFEKTKEDITVIIKCTLDSNMHNLVDMLDNQIEFGLTGQFQVDMSDPFLSYISKQLEEIKLAEYKRGMDFAVKQLQEGDQHGINS